MITFVVGDKKSQVSNKNFQSEFFKGMLELTGEKHLTIEVPSQYWPVAINYINFIRDKPAVIKSAEKLANCFAMNSFFIDEPYFKYLMSQMQQHWHEVANVVDSIHNDELLYDICLHLPFSLIPNKLKVSPNFVKVWGKRVDNKRVVLNSNKLVKTTIGYRVDGQNLEHEDFHNFRVTSTTNGIEDQLEILYYFYPGFRLEEEKPVINNNKVKGHYVQGLIRRWHDNGQLASEFNYVDGCKVGQDLTWHKNGQPRVKTTYYEGKLDGQYEQYTEGGTLLVSGEYHNGGRSGAWYDYDVSSGTTTQAHYRLNERNGKYRRYTASHDLLEAGQCSNNVKVGLWREWDYNRGVSSYGNYDKQGQRHTTWIETDIKSEKVLGSICYDHGRQLAQHELGRTLSEIFNDDDDSDNNEWAITLLQWVTVLYSNSFCNKGVTSLLSDLLLVLY